MNTHAIYWQGQMHCGAPNQNFIVVSAVKSIALF